MRVCGELVGDVVALEDAIGGKEAEVGHDEDEGAGDDEPRLKASIGCWARSGLESGG